MATDDDRCAEAKKVGRIEAAFRAGDLDALRAAVDDPEAVPNGRMPPGIGSCLVSAIYRSPLAFIRTLLEIGADPSAPADDGFPPLIAALSCTRAAPGATPRADVDDIVRLLLAFGADPNQRGINDYTPLHMAVAEQNPLAVQVLIDGGADPELRTRIDDCETPLDMARAAGLADIEALLEQKGALRRRLRSGLTLLEDNGESLITDVRIDRRSLVNGLFYGVEGMRVGGTRRLEIAPHLAYGDRGVPGVIPPGALLTAELTILAARDDARF